jgi:small subunit ribosomal protein S9
MKWLLSSSTASRMVRASPVTTAWRQPPAVLSPDVGGILWNHHLHRMSPLSRGGSAMSFSSARPPTSPLLRRAPPQQEDATTTSRKKWRTHAVSLDIGDYPDDDYKGADLMTMDDETLEEDSKKTWQEEEMDLAEEVKALQDEDDEQKKRWLESAKPPVRTSVIDERGRAYGRGGRKTASARVWIQPGLGHVVVNRQDFCDYFDRTTDRELVLAPLAATATCGKFDVTAMVTGGGLTGQAGAVRHGLARALNHFNPDVYRPPLKRLGHLTRDPRKVERKKVGHLKARKKPQWVKR